MALSLMTQSAIIYARFSTSEQTKGYSLERQRKLGAEFADSRGWTVEATITDEGRSAFHGANRLEGTALHQFELEAKGGIHTGKVLVIENIDRLSRQGPKAAAQLIWGLNENGVEVATFHDGYIYRATNGGDMMDLFRMIIVAQQAHEESSKKSKRTSASWQRRFEAIKSGADAGRVPHTPLWLTRTDGGFRPDIRRVSLLNEIYDLYIDGSGIHRIVTILNARDEPTWSPRDRSRVRNGWFYGYIYRLLTKRAVLGEYVTRDGEVLAVDFYPQVVTSEKWNRAQAALALRKGNQKNTKLIGNRNLLSQLVVCGACGGGAHFGHTTDSAQTYTKVTGEVVRYQRKTYRRLRCDKARRNHQCNNEAILNYDVVEAVVLEGFLRQLADRKIVNEALAAARVELAEAERLQEADQARLDRLIDLLEEGGSKAVLERVSKIESTMDLRSVVIENAKANVAMQASKPETRDDVALVESLRAELSSVSDDVRIAARGRVNMALRRLLRRIVIHQDATFQIELEDGSWWLFTDAGELLEGATGPAQPLN